MPDLAGFLNNIRNTTATIGFCEESLNIPIAQPANSWSNLFYIFAGIYIFILARNTKNTILKVLPWTAILVGIFSFSFHATNTLTGGALDLGTMFLFSSLLLSYNFYLLKIIPSTKVALFYFLLNFNSFFAYLAFIKLFQLDFGSQIFALQIAVIIITELIIFKKAKKKYSLRYFALTMILAGTAMSVWLLDFFKIWCDPATFHIINGHVIWHFLTSLCYVTAFYHYKQFPAVKD